MQRKRCRKCGETKVLDDFHKRTISDDGHHSVCKVCASEYQRRHMTRYCEICGASYYLYGDDLFLCVKCRREQKDYEPPKTCKTCTFLADCKRRVKQKDADWMPYCFVTSKHHEAWLKEYA